MGLENPLHIAFLLIIVLMVFGAKRLPEIGRSLGGGLRGFKDALDSGASPAAAQLQRVSGLQDPASEHPDQERAAA